MTQDYQHTKNLSLETHRFRLQGRRHFISCLIFICIVLLSACEAGTDFVIPTDPPTITPTFTPSPSNTPARNVTPTRVPTQVAQLGGASPTPLFGATRTSLPPDFPTATRQFNPNAPRIEFFTSDPLAVQPGSSVTLFWSARGVDNAVIYRLDEDGSRTQAYNVAPDGNLPLSTRSSDRGDLRFLLTIGEGINYTEQEILIPLQCPIDWFFSPPPEDCADNAPLETAIVDMTMQRGRMVYIQDSDVVYALFNDGQQPSWIRYENRYDPEIHPSRDESAPPDMLQPLDQLGFIWRSDNDVRTRLGLGLQEAITIDGFVQTSTLRGEEVVYISGANGVVLQILPGSEIWQVIGAPR
ncbi:MAG: hypothetical protein Q9P44_19655 [Anaerolineae bacterium]|nr:hypothetical protein [Anaerolineae bacterium]